MPNSVGKGKISSFSVYDTSTNQKLLDLIPVRKNGVGYMYDRVSGQLLGNSGTGDFVLGPDKPYDYEVEYIERDFTKPWTVNGSEVGSVGFDLSEYKPVDTAVKLFPNLRATYSFSPIGNNFAIAAGFTHVVLGQLMGTYTLGRNATVFSGNCSSLVTSSVEGVLTEFHTLEWSISEETDATLFLDGTSIGTASATSTKPTKFWVLVTRGKSASGSNQMRVKNVCFGSTVYLIPVVKGNAVGFYNMVDGHLFLEEQECLAAGPVV